jgi:hypothetical protein
MNADVKNWGLWLLRVVLGIVALLSFFGWVPLLASDRVSALPPQQIPAGGIPEWAKSFHINHGQVVFNHFGVPGDDPLPFVILLLVSLLAILALVMSFSKDARRRFLGNRFGNRER